MTWLLSEYWIIHVACAHTHTHTYTYTSSQNPTGTLFLVRLLSYTSPTRKQKKGKWRKLTLSQLLLLSLLLEKCNRGINSCLSTYSGGFGKFEGRGKGQYLWIYLQLLSCCFEANCKYLYPGDISLHQHDSLTDSITSSMYSMREASRNQSWGLLLEIPYTIRTRGYKEVQGFGHVRPAFSWHL